MVGSFPGKKTHKLSLKRWVEFSPVRENMRRASQTKGGGVDRDNRRL